MFDIVLELLRALVLLGILIFILYVDKGIEHGRRGWLFIKLGFLLILFGAFVDITDNFPSLNVAIVIGDTPIQAFLEKVVGYLGGFALLAVGFWLWLPSVQKMGRVQHDLDENRRTFEEDVMRRTVVLEQEVENRRTVEAALRQAEERRKLLYENAPIGIAHGLIGGSLVERNEEFARMLGYESSQELAQAAHGDNRFIWHNKQALQEVIALLRTEDRVTGIEVQLNHKDGSIVWVRLDFTTLEDEEGTKYYFYGFAVDITDRKLAEQLKEDVDRIVKHDLKSPVIGVVNACMVALMDDSIQGETRELFEVIQQKGRKVLSLIGLSLTLYKMEAGTYEYNPEKLDFMGVVRKVSEDQSRTAQNKNVTVQVLLDGITPDESASLSIMGNGLLFESLLANLLTNAIEASHPDKPVSIDIRSGDEVTIAITNTGAVPEDVRDTLFEKYATSGKYLGTGLGAYSASLTAKAVGGSVAMETSDENDNTTITVRLPGKLP